MAKSRRKVLPKQNKPGRRGDYKDAKKAPFLEAFKKIGFKGQAAAHVGVDRRTVDNWIAKDKKFADDFREADNFVTEMVETAALRRAVAGVERPIFRTDKNGNTVKVGSYRDYSDTLAALLLKARRPDVYKDRLHHEINPQVLRALVAALRPRFEQAVRSALPDCCPGCKTKLDLPAKVAKELMRLSEGFSSPAEIPS